MRVDDDGTVVFLDSNGQPLSDYLTNLAKRQQGTRIRELLERASTTINEETEALAKIHCHTPGPNDAPRYTPADFDMPRPVFPILKGVGFFAKLLGKQAQIDAENAEAKRRYEADTAEWMAAKSAFDEEQANEVKHFDEALTTDVEFMQDVLAESLSSIVWPRETLVSFQVDEHGTAAAIDVDLPEIEDIQRKTSSVPARGYKLTLKEVKGKALHDLYANHIHGVGFRIIGEVFATLPTINEVTLSAFTQRNSITTGHPDDTYVYSVRIGRGAWSQLNFDNLEAIDVVAAFEMFDLRRKFAKNGTLEEIAPFDVPVPVPRPPLCKVDEG